MSRRAGRVTKNNRQAPNWVALLSDCIDAIGDESFPAKLFATLCSVADIDYSVVFAYHQNEQPICLYHSFTSSERVVFVDDYLKGPYLLDPFSQACSRRVDNGLYRLRDIAPDRFLQSEYYRSYYVRTGLAEEICYIYCLPDNVGVAISLMRSGDSPRFSAREFRLLENVAPLVISLGQRHWQGLPACFEAGLDSLARAGSPLNMENTVAAVFGSRITPRETQVVAQVLEGHSSESISKRLGISTGTVRIHRRNVYAKLDISSQQELFVIFFNQIRSVRA